MWENLPPSFKLYCKKICNENNYETSSEHTTPTTLQGRIANQAETVPTVTTVKGKEIAIHSLRRLSVIHEGVEETTMDTPKVPLWTAVPTVVRRAVMCGF